MKNNYRASLVSDPKNWDWARKVQINILKNRIGLKPDQYLLDFGCGVLRGGIPIIDYLNVGHYYGIEKSENRIVEAKKELTENNLEWKKPKIGTGFDIIDKKIDIIWAFQVFIHCSDSILENILLKMNDIMHNKSSIYSTVQLSEEKIEDRKWQEYPVISRNIEFYSNLAKKNNLKVEIYNSNPIKDGLNFQNSTLKWTK